VAGIDTVALPCSMAAMKTPGAALAALRKRTWHRCAQCGKRFSGIAKAVYCSNACRQKAKYARAKLAPEEK
jgi:ribosomal protein L34E